MNEYLPPGLRIAKAAAINLNLGQETINNINKLSESASNYKIIDYDVIRFNINRMQNITLPSPYLIKINVEDIIKPLNLNVNLYKEVFSDFKIPKVLTQVDIENMLPKFNFNNISKIYSQTINESFQRIQSQLSVTSSIIKDINKSFTIYQELENRSALFNISTLTVDEDVDEEYKELWNGFVAFVIRSIPKTIHYTFGITQAFLTITEILSDSSNLMLLMFIYTHFNSLDKTNKDED